MGFLSRLYIYTIRPVAELSDNEFGTFNSSLQRAPTVFSTLGSFHCSDLLFVRSSQSEEELK